MKLNKETRSELIEALIDEDIKYAKEHDGLEVEYACERHNGWKGYSHWTDEELIERAIELHYGIPVKWSNE